MIEKIELFLKERPNQKFKAKVLIKKIYPRIKKDSYDILLKEIKQKIPENISNIGLIYKKSDLYLFYKEIEKKSINNTDIIDEIFDIKKDEVIGNENLLFDKKEGLMDDITENEKRIKEAYEINIDDLKKSFKKLNEDFSWLYFVCASLFLFLLNQNELDSHLKSSILEVFNINIEIKFFYIISFSLLLIYAFLINVVSIKENKMTFTFPISIFILIYTTVFLFSSYLKELLDIKNFNNLPVDYFSITITMLIIIMIKNINILLHNIVGVILFSIIFLIFYFICIYFETTPLSIFNLNYLFDFYNHKGVSFNRTKILDYSLMILLSIVIIIVLSFLVFSKIKGIKREKIRPLVTKYSNFYCFIEDSINELINKNKSDEKYKLANLSKSREKTGLILFLMLFFIYFFKQNLIDDYYSLYYSKNEGYCTNLEYDQNIIKDNLSNGKIILDLKLEYKNYKDNIERFIYEKCE